MLFFIIVWHNMFMYQVSVRVSYEKISLREIKLEYIVPHKNKNEHFVSCQICYQTISSVEILAFAGTLIYVCVNFIFRNIVRNFR